MVFLPVSSNRSFCFSIFIINVFFSKLVSFICNKLFLYRVNRLISSNFRKMRNINCGILGHVDSGKTTLSKCLSQIGSTNSFDKNPQSKERGITLDLGFSSFCPRDDVRVTLVDCPGHGSLPSGY